MPVGHPRRQLAELLEQNLPKTWAIIPAPRALDALTRTTVRITQGTTIRTPAAPIGVRTLEFTVTVISRYKTDPERAWDDLDGAYPTVLNVLDTHGIKWTTATPVVVDDTYFGYDIAVEINTTKENL